MMTKTHPPLSAVSSAVLSFVLAGALPQTAFGQAPAALASDRLSSRLIALPPTDQSSTAWVTDPSLKLEQQLAKRDLLARLERYQRDPDTLALMSLLEPMAITGRLLPTPSDAAVLLANPSADYALTHNSTVARLPVPSHIIVLGPNGRMCQIGSTVSVTVETLLQQCSAAQTSDIAWVVQADGTIATALTGRWNHFADTWVAPGAWVWAPPKILAQDRALMSDVAQFLSTQTLPSLGSETVVDTRPELLKNLATDASNHPTLGWKPLYTSNDWGETGLLQTPSARTGTLGDIRLNVSRAYPYTRMNVFMQPTGWLEFGFRYTDIATALYGASIAGEQTYKDKSFDFKSVLSEEGPVWPQIALGMRDIGGTGLFSSEYIVASKRFGEFDWNLGIGWGNLGSRAAFPNPLGALFPALKKRQREENNQGGTISASSMFAGDAALFGGVQWTSPDQRSSFKLEIDGNSYALEPFGQDFGATSPVNIGWLYRWSPSVDLSLALERGNRLAFSFTFNGNLRNTSAPKYLDAPPIGNPPRISARTTAVQPMAGTGLAPLQATQPPAEPLAKRLHTQIQAQTGWKMLALEASAGTWQLRLETDDAVYAQDRLERLFVVLATELPAQGNLVQIELTNFGLPLRSVQFDRTEWLAQRVYPELPALQLNAAEWQRPSSELLNTKTPDAQAIPPIVNRWESGWGTTFAHILGGPNNFLLYQAGLRTYGQYRFDENTWAYAQANLRLIDNYDNFVYNAPSNLPRVRTDQRLYVTSSRATIPVAQLTKTIAMGNGHYASAYGGLLEPMYAGVGAEWLWRPWQKNWAVGVDINQVQQRDYVQDLGLRDYRTTTGHATLYWNTGFDGVVAKISAGKYLAKDVGATLDLSRTFTNGTAIGVWATKTNVSAEQFGEGSFDKGIYINIPLDALLPRSTPSMATVVWSPLSRDGGSRLGRQFALFDLTRHADKWAWTYSPTSTRNNKEEESRESRSLLGAMFPHRSQGANLSESMQLNAAMADAGIKRTSLLWGAGAVLATMAFDQRLTDALANTSGTNGTNTRAESTMNSLPYALAAGAGVAALGTLGEDARTTAYASLSAATWALGTNMLVKTLVGRARPDEARGPGMFTGPNTGSSQSSFASNHVTAAMALVTPFAQRYNQPWLYGLAGLTALGRIQSRDHWASDTVAGALLGYAFGTLAVDQQTRHNKKGLSIAPTGNNEVVATYRY